MLSKIDWNKCGNSKKQNTKKNWKICMTKEETSEFLLKAKSFSDKIETGWFSSRFQDDPNRLSSTPRHTTRRPFDKWTKPGMSLGRGVFACETTKRNATASFPTFHRTEYACMLGEAHRPKPIYEAHHLCHSLCCMFNSRMILFSTSISPGTEHFIFQYSYVRPIIHFIVYSVCWQHKRWPFE